MPHAYRDAVGVPLERLLLNERSDLLFDFVSLTMHALLAESVNLGGLKGLTEGLWLLICLVIAIVPAVPTAFSLLLAGKRIALDPPERRLPMTSSRAVCLAAAVLLLLVEMVLAFSAWFGRGDSLEILPGAEVFSR